MTKYRRRCLSAELLQALRGIFDEQLAGKGGRLVEFNAEAHHVHLLLELPPKPALSAALNNLKTVSSRLLRKRYAEALAKV